MGSKFADIEGLDEKLASWKDYLLSYKLPTWDEIPNIGLYMDQVITQLDTYFDYLAPDIKGDPLATKAMINNYVRLGILPRPVKKRYYRIHLAYLIIICMLKSSMSISQISASMPPDLSEDEVRRSYEHFSDSLHRSAQHFCDSVARAIAPLTHGEVQDRFLQIDNFDDVIICGAVIGNFNNLLAQKLHNELSKAKNKDGEQNGNTSEDPASE